MSFVGFTGSRNGMNENQRDKFLLLINSLNPLTFHHGCCFGADLQAHELLKRYVAIRRIGHPPWNLKLANIPKDLDEVRERKSYLARNDSIVAESVILIATPDSFKEKIKSGTWYTIRKARKSSRRIFIIYPDGSHTEEAPQNNVYNKFKVTEEKERE